MHRRVTVVILSVDRSVNIGSQQSLGFKPSVKYQIKVGDILRGNKKLSFSTFGLVFKKKATELRLWGHTQSSAHPVLFGKHHHIVVFYRQVWVSFLYLSCSAIMDSPGGEFSSYKSKCLGQM